MTDTLKTAMDRALNNLDYGDEFTAADLRAILDSHAALRTRLAEVEEGQTLLKTANKINMDALARWEARAEAAEAKLAKVEADQHEMVKRYDAMTRRVEQAEIRAEAAEAKLSEGRG